MKKDNITFVPILDPGVSIGPNGDKYDALKNGLAQDIFIKSPATNTPLTGKMWGENTYFPDFMD